MSYDKEFYARRRKLTSDSASKIFEVLWKYIQPTSILDVGCATGIWLAEAKRNGVHNIYGIDGPWVPEDALEIELREFRECDLSISLPSLPTGTKKFGLVLCIELAEHLPEHKGQELLDFLTDNSDLVLFSAAIPGQGGTGHINEQRQSYWYNEFSKRGYECFDLIRPVIWENEDVNIIYKQNMLLYARTKSDAHGLLSNTAPENTKISDSYDLDRVTPELFYRRSVANKNNITKPPDFKTYLNMFIKRVFPSR